MKKPFFLLILLLGLSQLSTAQLDCSGGRYTNEIFTNFTLTSDITYGNNINRNNISQSLELDVREPAGDTASLRPLLIMACGGNFITSVKTQNDVVPICEIFARKGYVTASIEYRVGMDNLPVPGPDSTDASEAVLRATHDARAAVRYFRKDVVQNGNTWKIDTNNIFFGGSSAGGFMALHLAYLDDINKLPTYIDTNNTGLGGGIEGNSGNPGYSSTVTGVINISGALGDTAFMKGSSTPVLSFHGDQDNVVPFATDMITLVGTWDLFVVDGSYSVHAHANKLGILNCFKPYWGAGHAPQWIGPPTNQPVQTYLDTTTNYMTDFMLHFVCGEPFPSCSQVPPTGIVIPRTSALTDIMIYPNPSSEIITIEAPTGTELLGIKLFDNTGKLVKAEQKTSPQKIVLSRKQLANGLYLLKVETSVGTYSSKVIFQD